MADKASADGSAKRAIADLAAQTATSAREVADAQRVTARKLAARKASGVSIAALKAAIKAGDPHKVTRVSGASMEVIEVVADALAKASDPLTLAWGTGGVASRIARAQQAGLSLDAIRERVALCADWSELAAKPEEGGLPVPVKDKADGDGDGDGDGGALTLATVEAYLEALAGGGVPLSDADGEALGRIAALARKAKLAVK